MRTSCRQSSKKKARKQAPGYLFWARSSSSEKSKNPEAFLHRWWCRKPGSNRYEVLSSRDFKSRASTNFAIPAFAVFIVPQNRWFVKSFDGISSYAHTNRAGKNNSDHGLKSTAAFVCCQISKYSPRDAVALYSLRTRTMIAPSDISVSSSVL